MSTSADFVRANTRLAPVPFLPELVLHQADEPIELWERTEEGGAEQPPPFWAFAWAGGQALARHVLDEPELVAGRHVLDLATGSGLVAVAAARAGARPVTANDIDPFSLAAAEANAAANRVRLELLEADLLADGYDDAAVVLAGDVFYSREMAGRVLPFLRRAAGRGALVLVGDPGRAYLPVDGMVRRATYDVPVIEALESVPVRRTSVWQVQTGR
ncbi:ribosomal protein L11 methyltransferase [Actinoplanes sp. NBRC 14428]|uniref:Putative nicotinamide N-methyase n=1 Tax=Pseudosporangium ferrugineum TaxID=439699 RepID=A0A2T0RU64_9ACTN|nr:50S ribosomal protein L11 methyltransferase [Pseudosporangium ferrugineum]PRY24735.1 putative nicotinamide N-methyase [Pseudosporangium ferrugineum]BCJ54986.1 ribosomal protein L11 methyltransferase [Actinoplanes sp. NBRC 14428]